MVVLTQTLAIRSGDFLTPDEVTFAVLLRGYGAAKPPGWTQIDAVLTRMRQDYAVVPTASEQLAAGWFCNVQGHTSSGSYILSWRALSA